MTEQRAEKPITPDQGTQTPLGTERGSERFSIEHGIKGAIYGAALGILVTYIAAKLGGFNPYSADVWPTAVWSIVFGTGIGGLHGFNRLRNTDLDLIGCTLIGPIEALAKFVIRH